MDGIEKRDLVRRKLKDAGYTFKKVQDLYGLKAQDLTYHLARPFVCARVVVAVNGALDYRLLDKRGQIIEEEGK